MVANNPHLQKKRSSKRGLGRSFMRRITEIPESISRQCSKEEKDGSVGGGSVSHSGSYKKRHLDSGSSSMKLKDDSSSKPKAASTLKKSHSTYDHTRDTKENNVLTRHESCKEAPLLDSMMRKKIAKKVSERSNSDSLDDSAPLVYKSASAHNLTAERKPLHPKPSPLQKSLSVVTSAKEKALLLTHRAYLEDNSKLAQDKGKRPATTESEVSADTGVTDVLSKVAVKDLQADDTSQRTVSSLLEDSSSSKDIVCPWESATAPSTPSENRSQKHVTYTPIRSVSINTSELTGRRHHASKKIPPEPPIRQQSLVHSLERKNASPWDAQEQTQTSRQSLKKDSKDSPMLADICPSEKDASPDMVEMQRNEQTEDNIAPSSPAGLPRLASIAAEVCPWEVMEVSIPKKKDPEASESASQKSSPEKQSPSPLLIPKSSIKGLGLAIKAFNRSRIKASIRARKDDEGSPKKNGKEMSEKNEKLQKAEGTLTSVGESPSQQAISRSPRERRPEGVSKQATICPWDEEEEALSSLHKNSPRKVLEVCPWEASDDGVTQGRASSAEVAPSTFAGEIACPRLDRTKSQRESVCPWETIDDDHTGEENISNISLIVLKAEKKVEICPWELPEATHSARSEVQEKASDLRNSKETKEPYLGTEIKKSPDLSKTEQKKSRNVESHKFNTIESEISMNVKTEVCPWESEEPQSEQQVFVEDNEGPPTKKSTTSRAAAIKTYHKDTICPLETMELPEKADTKITLSQRGSDRKTNITTAICPWETSDTPLEEPRGESREDSRGLGGRKLRSPLLEETKDREGIPRETVCPWENADDEDSSVKPAGKILELSKVVLKKSSSGDIKKIAVCPWEMETAEVCPWEEASSTLEKGMKEREGRPSKVITLKAPPTLQALEDSAPRESVCPWEDTEAEAALLKPSAKPLELSKASSDSFQSKKREIVPWEIKEAEIDIKTAICPWESDDTPVLKREFKKDASSVSKDEKKRTTDTAPEEGSNGKKESVSSWERAEDKDVLIKPKPQRSYVSKGISKKSDSVESLKTAVCPWETENIEVCTKADICPWDVTPAPSDKRSSRQEASGTLKSTRGIVSKPAEKTTTPRETICPLETMDIDDPSSGPCAKRPSLPKVKSKNSSSTDSLKAELCPWESQEGESSIKVDICPWEAPESPAGERSASTFERLAPQNEASSKITEKTVSPRESICPWETMDTDNSLSEPDAKSLEVSKVSSKKSGSTETLKAEVCPWESQETEHSIKAAVYPQEVPESPVDERPSLKIAGVLENQKLIPLKQTGHSKAIKKVSSPRETICPWETIDTDNPSFPSSAESPPLSRLSYKISSSSDTLKEEVCPWESQEAEPSAKADVCPWKVSESSLDKRPSLKRAGALERSKSTSLEQIVHFNTVQKMSSPEESVCPWEFSAKSEQSKVVSKKSDSAESLKAEVCPWEVVEESVLRKDGDCKANQREDSRNASPMSISEAMERLSRSREDVCPWESMDLEGPSVRSSGQSPALSKAGSRKSDSAESLRAEICPWEFTEEDEVSTKTEVYPWTAAMAPFEKGKLKEDPAGALKGKKHQVPLAAPESKKTGGESSFKKIEKSKSHQESASLCKNMEFDKPPAKSTRSLDLLQVSSKKSESVESLKAEVCPWEFQELPTHAKAEICPWEVAEGPPERGTLKNYQGMVSTDEISTKPMMGTLKTEEGGGSQQEAGRSCESVELSQSRSPSLPKGGSQKSGSVESLRAEVCPWETEEEEPSGKIEMCSSKSAPVAFDEGSLRQNISQGKTQLSPGVVKVVGKTVSKNIEKTHSHAGVAHPQKNTDELSIKPSSESLDLPKAIAVKSDSIESLKAEICPCGVQEAGATRKAEVCPWEVAGSPPDREASSRDTAAISKMDVKVDSKSPVETIRTLEEGSSPREKPDSSKSRKAEICPWETDQPERVEICPWEARAVLPTKDERATVHASAAETPAVERSQNKQKGLPGHKPLCRSLPETTLPVDLSKRSGLMVDVLSKSRHGSTVADICPWEAEEDTTSTRKDSSGVTKGLSEVCPWETEGISPTTAIPTAKSKAGKKPQGEET